MASPGSDRPGLEPGSSSAEQAELVAARKRIRELETETRGAPSCDGAPQGEGGPKRRFAAIHVMVAEGLPAQRACRVLDVSESRYYAWRSRPPCRGRGRARIVTSLTRISRTGSWTCTPMIRSSVIGSSPMNSMRPGTRRTSGACGGCVATSGSGPRPPRVARLLAPAPNVVWLTDITEHPTVEGKVCVCAIKDVLSNRIVGYAIDQRMTKHLAVSALRSAIVRRQPDGTVIAHSDHGSQFRSRNLRAVLRAVGLRGSMGRVASAGDNAAMKSFHALFQKNVLDRRRWRTRAELRYAIVTWIEHTDRRRRQRALGKLTPVEYELAFTTPAAAA
ncbi:MAG: IS3 family transposase [Actinobacteria bacterium]|nr:IS3 family transposase [Actinomycetota bacterium]